VCSGPRAVFEAENAPSPPPPASKKASISALPCANGCRRALPTCKIDGTAAVELAVSSTLEWSPRFLGAHVLWLVRVCVCVIQNWVAPHRFAEEFRQGESRVVHCPVVVACRYAFPCPGRPVNTTATVGTIVVVIIIIIVVIIIIIIITKKWRWVDAV
jgi:hypothetical protein